MRTFVYPASFERGAKRGVLVIAFRDVPEAIAGRIADGLEVPKASRATRGERCDSGPGANGCEGGTLSRDGGGRYDECAVGAKAWMR
jgi:hypothetical protein